MRYKLLGVLLFVGLNNFVLAVCKASGQRTARALPANPVACKVSFVIRMLTPLLRQS